MAWTAMDKFLPLLPAAYEWLNNLSTNMLHLYNNKSSKSFAIPEPCRLDAKGSWEDQEWDDYLEWTQSDVDEKGVEYVFLYDGVRRFLWYRYALRGSAREEPNDLPHLTFGHGFGSSRHEDGFAPSIAARTQMTTGTSTSSGVGSLTDSGASWATNEYANKWAEDDDGEQFEVISNTQTILTLNTSDTPATGTYYIWSARSGGGDTWNVQDIYQVRQLIPGMILSVHTVRCAMLREVSA